MVDTGLMRKDEFKYTYKIFKNKYKLNVKLINSSKIILKKTEIRFRSRKKRKIIGKLFVKYLKVSLKNLKM